PSRYFRMVFPRKDFVLECPALRECAMKITPFALLLALSAVLPLQSAFALDSDLTNLSQLSAYQMRAGAQQRRLPPTVLDSFVYNAGANAENIYGDEGVNGLPPIDNFKKCNRIDAGITGIRDLGLTTGHGSVMPDAWGADEFISVGEWTQSGAKGNMANPVSISATNLDSRVSNRGGSGGSIGSDENIPPPPGPGYQPVYTHGVFDGYLTPEEADLWNNGNPAAAWKSFANRRPGGPTENDIFIITREMGGTYP
ncbi:MAG TPA: hypothetical protein PL112_20100, partial [Candidatus Obscuribacter sp.]|nr:hypothetical protein [Candidatus Obscuribacter sp.]